jgi:hypothetical protein
VRLPGGLWKLSLIGQDWVPDSCLPYTGRQLLSDEHRWDLSGVVRKCPFFKRLIRITFRLGGTSSFLSGLSDTRTKGPVQWGIRTTAFCPELSA